MLKQPPHPNHQHHQQLLLQCSAHSPLHIYVHPPATLYISLSISLLLSLCVPKVCVDLLLQTMNEPMPPCVNGL